MSNFHLNNLEDEGSQRSEIKPIREVSWIVTTMDGW